MNHSQAFRAESEDEISISDVATVIMDRDNSPALDEADKAMLAFTEKMTFDCCTLTEDDLNALREVGFTDENVLDIIGSVAYRNMSNRLNIALGLDADDPEGPRR
jgi:uncharacterized peroxidase-related enzyme